MEGRGGGRLRTPVLPKCLHRAVRWFDLGEGARVDGSTRRELFTLHRFQRFDLMNDSRFSFKSCGRYGPVCRCRSGGELAWLSACLPMPCTVKSSCSAKKKQQSDRAQLFIAELGFNSHGQNIFPRIFPKIFPKKLPIKKLQ